MARRPALPVQCQECGRTRLTCYPKQPLCKECRRRRRRGQKRK